MFLKNSKVVSNNDKIEFFTLRECIYTVYGLLRNKKYHFNWI